jgi:hypothetical protein
MLIILVLLTLSVFNLNRRLRRSKNHTKGSSFVFDKIKKESEGVVVYKISRATDSGVPEVVNARYNLQLLLKNEDNVAADTVQIGDNDKYNREQCKATLEGLRPGTDFYQVIDLSAETINLLIHESVNKPVDLSGYIKLLCTMTCKEDTYELTRLPDGNDDDVQDKDVKQLVKILLNINHGTNSRRHRHRK